MYLDTHTHVYPPYFKESEIKKAVDNAKKADTNIIINNGINKSTNRAVLELSKKYPELKAALGIYPFEALQKNIKVDDYVFKPDKFDVNEEIEFIKKNKNGIIAIGEIGLDFTIDETKPQLKVFEDLLELAQKINKPVSIHSRKAEQETIEILESLKQKKVIMHCFSGKKKFYKTIADNGWYFSVPTNVVHSKQFQTMVQEVNLSNLFCETDAPYLGPFKDKKNEPAFIVEAYKKIAEIKKMELKEVENIIFNNYQKLFL